jgi:hypothetical protein
MKDRKGSAIAYGLMIGTTIGIFTDNLGLWISMGIIFGAAYETRIAKRNAENKKNAEEL